MLITILVNFVPVIIAIVLHEAAHGYAAFRLGDNTAKLYGRLTLNPFKHVDVFGTLILPTILILSKTGIVFGWAKPVPVNFNNLKKIKRDTVIVASAGIVVNIVLAICAALLLKLTPHIANLFIRDFSSQFLINLVGFNIVLAVFNVLPIPPLDGSKILFGWSENKYLQSYVNAYRQGSLFILFIVFVMPVIAGYLGFNFNPFGFYIVEVSKFFISLLV